MKIWLGISYKLSAGQMIYTKCQTSLNKKYKTRESVKPKDAPRRYAVVGGLFSERVKYFKRYATDKLIIAKIKMRSNSIITCNRVTVLALCTISDGRFSMY